MKTESDFTLPGVMRWHAVIPKIGMDAAAAEMFRRANCRVYVPMRTVRTVIRGSVRTAKKPILPGYVFVRFRGSVRWNRVFEAPSVADVLRLRTGEPGIITPAALTRLAQAIHGLTAPQKPTPPVLIGQSVTITAGAFAGHVGEVTALRSANGLRVRLTILGAARDVAVDLSGVEIAA